MPSHVHRFGEAASGGDVQRHRARQVAVVSMTLNGEPVQVGVPAHWTLLEMLRYHLRLTGTKQGCDKGDCGACTVTVDGRAALSCITLALHAEGREVVTVEGLGVGRAHPLQDAFELCGAAQCGFCTPGMLMSAAAFFEAKRASFRADDQAGEHAVVTRTEVANALGGNLCRCTGYTKILDAVQGAWSQVRDDERSALESR